MSYILEVCANAVQSAVNAQKAGAKRVELCCGLWESGTSPSFASIKIARELLNIDLFVLVRPRGGDFVYSDLEFQIMKEEILNGKELGVNGIVSGVLNADNTIDINRTKELIELSKPLPFTFHRAFDITPNLEESLQSLISIKADRVLTSGAKKCVADAHETISQLNKIANNKLKILAGGGLKISNVQQLLNTGCSEFHMTGNELVKSAASKNSLQLNSLLEIPENDFLESSVGKIKKMVALLNNHFNK